MSDFAGVNQIGLNKVTWGIPMVIRPDFSLCFLQAIFSSHAPPLSVILASFIWWQIASCSNMNTQVVAGMMISLFRLCFSSDSSSWDRTNQWRGFQWWRGLCSKMQGCVCDSVYLFIPKNKEEEFYFVASLSQRHELEGFFPLSVSSQRFIKGMQWGREPNPIHI